jgi:putative iron-only hydrogenase system regulator
MPRETGRKLTEPVSLQKCGETGFYFGGIMEKRLGFVGIVVEERQKSAPQVNSILTEFGDLIAGRMGMPYSQKQCSVITLIVDATTDELGRMTGKLGSLPGVSVKSALSKGK